MAIQPDDGKIYAPVSGKVVTVADTLHAYGIRAEDGSEILIHVGLDSVTLKGKDSKAV
jgi:phosphotransferase system IIA component